MKNSAIPSEAPDAEGQNLKAPCETKVGSSKLALRQDVCDRSTQAEYARGSISDTRTSLPESSVAEPHVAQLQQASASHTVSFRHPLHDSFKFSGAVIDHTGKVHHSDECPCATSTLEVDLECRCDYVSHFNHNDTSMDDYLCAYDNASKMLGKQKGFRFERKSNLLEEAKSGVRDASEMRNFRMAEASLLDQEAS